MVASSGSPAGVEDDPASADGFAVPSVAWAVPPGLDSGFSSPNSVVAAHIPPATISTAIAKISGKILFLRVLLLRL
jgi:hypothetical protein